MRLIVWIALGLTCACGVMLSDLSRLLSEVQSAGYQAYDAGVFTGLTVPWSAGAITSAVEVWRSRAPEVIQILSYHALIDFVLFAPAYAVLIAAGLRVLGVDVTVARGAAIWLVVADALETGYTYLVLVHRELDGEALRDLGDEGAWLATIHWLSLAKWLVIATALIALIRSWSSAADGLTRRSIVNALFGLMVLVGLFIALVALPAGGALDQLPDVIRYQLSEAPWSVKALSLAALVLLAGAVAAAGRIAVKPVPSPVPPPVPPPGDQPEPAFGVLFIATLALTGVVLVLQVSLDKRVNWVAAAPAAVFLGTIVLYWLRVWVQPNFSSQPALASLQGDWPIAWVGALAGLVVVAGGVALIRGAFLPLLFSRDVAYHTTWLISLILGLLIAVGGGFLTQYLVCKWAGFSNALAEKTEGNKRWDRIPGYVVIGLVVAMSAWLAIQPSAGVWFGTPGVLAIGFAGLALIIGTLTLASRRLPAYFATASLGFRLRTPFLTLLVVTWVVASALNTEGGYHDARVDSSYVSGTERRTLHVAFEKWAERQTGACSDASTGTPVPMFLVAAAGGGIRAAYWTSAVLEELFGTRGDSCAAARLFAISSVSGGSVGGGTWLTALSKNVSGREAVGKLSADHALASATAALLFRDLWQPLVGNRKGWGNRAALMEDGWLASTSVLGSIESPLKWSEMGASMKWVPVLVLNASSVNDGCRVLLSNIKALPAARGADCTESSAETPPVGSVSASIDPLDSLIDRRKKDEKCPGTPAGLRAVTALLLSSRFPIITPTGGLHHCPPEAPRPASTYTLDGGYHENSGLLTLEEIWRALAPAVWSYNQTAAGKVHPIDPWIVVVDNHYRSEAIAAGSGRPREVVAPIAAFISNRLTAPAAVPEQLAAISILKPANTEPSAARPPQQNPDGHEEPAETPPVTAFPQVPGHLIVISPSVSPSIAAPLGWVLSPASREGLEHQLDEALKKRSSDDSATQAVLAQLRREQKVIRSDAAVPPGSN